MRSALRAVQQGQEPEGELREDLERLCLVRGTASGLALSQLGRLLLGKTLMEAAVLLLVLEMELDADPGIANYDWTFLRENVEQIVARERRDIRDEHTRVLERLVTLAKEDSGDDYGYWTVRATPAGRHLLQAALEVSKGPFGDLIRAFLRDQLAGSPRADEPKDRGLPAGTLAHELRNQLNPIGVHIKTLRKRLERGVIQGEGLSEVIEGLDRTLSGARRFLEEILSAMSAGQTELISQDPLQVARDVVVELRDAQSSQITLQADERVGLVLSSGTGLERAVRNLVINACEAVRGREEGRVLVKVVRGNGGSIVRVVVSDNGPGVSDENLGQLFTPGFTTKPGGQGMGLFVARQIVEQEAGGKLSIEQNISGGCDVVMELPAVGGSQ